MHPRITLTLTAIGSVTALLVAAGCSPANADAASDRRDRTVTGTATGTATGVPDTATISLGADSRGTSATEALASNAKRVEGVIAAMRFVGVPERDIQTTNIAVFPTFDTRGRITGYTVSTRMTAKTHDVPGAGKVIDAAAKLGGDDLRVDSINLSIEDTGPVVRAARKRAVSSAHDQAAQLAAAAHVRLGPVRTIVEQHDQTPTGIPLAFAADSATHTPAIPVSAGTQDLQIRVKVVYEIG